MSALLMSYHMFVLLLNYKSSNNYIKQIIKRENIMNCKKLKSCRVLLFNLQSST